MIFFFFVEAEVDGVSYRNYRVFRKWRDLELPDPEISLEDMGELIELTAKRPAFGVKILADEVPEDDFLFLEPGRSVTLRKPAGVRGVKSLFDYLR